MKKLTEKELINRFNIIHDYKFDYSLMDYKDINSKIIIKCPIHGPFEQTVKNHLNGNDCFECSKRKKSKTTKIFVDLANKIHDNFYSYPNTKYKNNLTRVEIECPIHGPFEQLPKSHLKGSGCKKCGIDKTKSFTLMSLDDFKRIANKIHDNFYNYDRVKYVNSYTKVEIVCPNHGPFFQKPQDHIHSKCGCPICSESKGEKSIRMFLKKLNMDFTPQKTFCDLKHKNCLSFDFYLPEYNCCIEFDGEQHFAPFDIFGGEEAFDIIKMRDKLKKLYCEKNNIRLLRITYKDKDNIEKIIKDFLSVKEHRVARFKDLI